MNINDKIADAFIGHQVDLVRIEAGLERDILAMMQELSASLSTSLAKLPLDSTSIPRKLQRLQGLQQQTDALIDDLYAKLAKETASEMQGTARLELQTVPAIINSAIGVDLAGITLTTELVNSLAKDANVLGIPALDWWEKQSAALKFNYLREMRQGILQGENLADLTRRLRGRRENGFADGLLPPLPDETGRITRAAVGKATRDAQGLAITSVQQVMAGARMAAYQQNSDILKGTMQLSTLDKRTSPICRAYDHAQWDLTGKPIGPKLLPFNGGPPRHWRCRSVLIPITKSYAELGIKGKDLPPGTRASMDGQVPGNLDYEAWLKGKPAAFQQEVLGPARYRLWQQGNLPLAQMIDQHGRPIRVKDLLEPETPPVKFEPADSIKAAAAWAVQNNIADMASYKGAALETANQWNQSIFEHVQEFPELRKNFKFIGTTQERQRAYVELRFQELTAKYPTWSENSLRQLAKREAGKTPPSIYAYSIQERLTNGICVNSKWGGDVPAFKKQLGKDVASSFHPPGCDSIKSVVDHEIAHQLDALLNIQRHPEFLTILQDHFTSGGDLPTGLSRYALKSHGEVIAECWAESRNNPQPRELAIKVAGLIRREYNLKYGGQAP